jgi:hypothetical protein
VLGSPTTLLRALSDRFSQGGKVLLNARLYVGMRLDLQNGAVSTFLHTMVSSWSAVSSQKLYWLAFLLYAG